jgi:glycosyltransferase involved in cell wall biosynthesis
MPDTLWTRGKSGYKVLEYMAMEIPPLASAVGENCRIVDHGVTGFLVSNEDEWLTYLLRLLNDEELRALMGVKARRIVEEHFSLEKNARLLAEIMVSARCHERLESSRREGGARFPGTGRC